MAGALAFRWDGRRTRFFFHTRAGSYTDAALIPFLRDLKRHFPRPRVMLIWDGLGAHKSRAMAAYLARQRAWLTVERLPAYARELNPIEQVWGNVKGCELANVCAPDLAALVMGPLGKAGYRLWDVDRYATEMHNPEVTEPAGAGDVPAGNYRLIAALGILRGDIPREGMRDFMLERGLPCNAPTQGHIASAVCYLAHALQAMRAGKMKRMLFMAKGSLFPGRMTEASDGVSFLLEA